MIRWFALLLCAAGAWAGQPWTPDDYWNWRSVTDPRISPDGRQVVYLDTWNDRASNSVCANLRLVSIGDRQSRPLTEGAWQDRSPRWSADSTHIAWISGRGGIHVLVPGSGQESAIEAKALSFAWSADGRWIAFTAALPAEDVPPSWAPPAILPWVLQPHLPARTGLFVVATTGGPARAITGATFDAAGEPAWMPDGKSILVASTDGEIDSVRIADGVVRRLNQEPGHKENPLPAPNGSKIAWMATDPAPHSYSVRKLFTMIADGSQVKAVAAALDRDPAFAWWSSDSRTIYFAADDSGSTHVFAARADSTVRQVTRSVERLTGFSVADNGHAVAVRATDRSEELISFAVDLPSTPVVLAAPMQKLLAERVVAAVEEIRFPSAGKSIQGWLVKPPGFDAARKYPLLLDIADAPRRMYGPEFSLRAQMVAARGWLVLRLNPRGTPGYGEEFGRLLPTGYPGDDADDLLAGVDTVCTRSYVDARRVAVSGGLLTAWLIGHTDRFTTAIARRPIVDFTLFAASGADNARQALAWLGAMPWEDSDRYLRRSPIYFAQNWKTPTLILAHDPDPQADELRAALQLRKVESATLRIPDDKPASRILEMQALLAWLERTH